jgi:hypothetical protein
LEVDSYGIINSANGSYYSAKKVVDSLNGSKRICSLVGDISAMKYGWSNHSEPVYIFVINMFS